MNINKLTLGEIARVEELSELSINSMGDADKPKAKLMAALAYVVMKRENPKVTMAEAEALTMDEVNELLGL